MPHERFGARRHHVIAWPNSSSEPPTNRAGVLGADRDVNEHRVSTTANRHPVGVHDLPLGDQRYEADRAETATVEPAVLLPEVRITGTGPPAVLLAGLSDRYDWAPPSVASVHAPAPTRLP